MAPPTRGKPEVRKPEGKGCSNGFSNKEPPLESHEVYQAEADLATAKRKVTNVIKIIRAAFSVIDKASKEGNGDISNNTLAIIKVTE